MPCDYSGPGKWDIDVKESGSFYGSELPVTGNRTTPVTGRCGLAFGTPPTDAAVGAVLTGNPFDQSGPPLTVTIVDGSGSPGLRRVRPGDRLARARLGLGPLTGTTSQVTTDGVATFADLRVGSPGLYAIKAEIPGLPPLFSAFFNVDTSGVECVENVTCSVTATTGDSSLTLTAAGNPQADAGILRLSFDVGLQLDCAGYTELTADTAVFEMTGGRAKVATLQIAKSQMNGKPNNGAAHLAALLRRAAAVPDADGDGRAGRHVRLGRRRGRRARLQGAAARLRRQRAAVREQAQEDRLR